MAATSVILALLDKSVAFQGDESELSRESRVASATTPQAGLREDMRILGISRSLDVFSDPANGGGITVPVTAQDGWFGAGSLRVFRLLPVVSFPGAGSQSQSRARRGGAPRPGQLR